MNPQAFAEFEQERDARRRKVRIRRYLAAAEILILTIPTAIHEGLHRLLDHRIAFQIYRMGLESTLQPMGSVTLRAMGHPNGDGGEGDSTSGPFPERAGATAWPTLVIEAGHSETLGELRKDMRWWFAASGHQVKIVLLAKFHAEQKDIILETWTEEEAQSRQGATRTRRAASLTPVCRQTIAITKDATNPALYNVARGALRLDFRLLFGRDPQAGEGDVIIGVTELQTYAANVWARSLPG